MMNLPSDRRQAFHLAVELKTPSRSIAKAVSDCPDIMPRDLCAELDLPQGSTYAQGARRVMASGSATQCVRRVV